MSEESRTETVTIDYCDTGEPTELYRHYPGETDPQPVEILFDLDDGEMRARYNPEIGNAVPARVWNRVVRLWSVPAILTSAAANELMDDIKPLAEQLLAESSTGWDGSNHAGSLTDRGEEIEAEIQQVIWDYADDPDTGRVEYIDAGDLLGQMSLEQVLTDDGIEVTADTTDERLDEIAADLARCAEASNDRSVTVVEGLDEMLAQHRDELRDAERERLTELRDQLDQIKADRNALVVRINSWGEKQDTTRSLGDLAGVSRTEISRICSGAAEE